MFSFSRSLHIAFQTAFTSLNFHQQGISVPFSPASSPTFVVVSVLDTSYPNRSAVES
jgi:hypothetical protein